MLSQQLTDPNGFDIGTGPVAHLLRYLSNPYRQEKLVISSEGFANCLYARRARGRFFDFLGAARKLNDGVFVVFRLRPFAQYFDSWYVQRLTSGTVTLDMDDYVTGCMHWLKNYIASLKALKETIGAENIMLIDVAEGGGDAVTALLSRMGAPRRVTESEENRFNSRLGLKKAAVIYRLQQLANSKKAADGPEIAALRRAIVRSKDIPDDIQRYRVIPFQAASSIQFAAHKCVLPFMRPQIANCILPEREFYDEVSLADVKLSSADLEFVDNLLPAELRSGELYENWRKKFRGSGG